MITSTSNKKIKDVVSLMKKASARKERGVFIVEGIKMFSEIPFDDIEEVYASESFLENAPAGCLEGLEDKCEAVTDTVYAYMSDTKTPQGILAIVKKSDYELDDLLGERPALMVLETLQDPGNLGTIIRMAEAAGITGIVMNNETCDVYNPKVVRSTMGAIFRVPFLYTADLEGTIGELKAKGVRTYAAHLDGKESYDKFDFTAPSAFMIGNESNGLSERIAALADEKIIIPMLGKVESLNAAIAASILSFELARQRRN